MKFSLVFVLCLLVGSSYSLPKFVRDAEDDCGQNDHDGLGPFVKELFYMIPLNKVMSTVVEYLGEDQEVIDAFEFIESPEFYEILSTMQKMHEFSVVLEFFCVDLKLNVYYYMNAVGSLFGLPVVTRPPMMIKSSTRLQPGLKGMIAEIIAILPIEDMKAFLIHSYETNEYVRLALENLRSDEFRIVSEKVEALPEFQLMVSRLAAVGFDTETMIRAIKDFLGFP